MLLLQYLISPVWPQGNSTWKWIPWPGALCLSVLSLNAAGSNCYDHSEQKKISAEISKDSLQKQANCLKQENVKDHVE